MIDKWKILKQIIGGVNSFFVSVQTSFVRADVPRVLLSLSCSFLFCRGAAAEKKSYQLCSCCVYVFAEHFLLIKDECCKTYPPNQLNCDRFQCH